MVDQTSILRHDANEHHAGAWRAFEVKKFFPNIVKLYAWNVLKTIGGSYFSSFTIFIPLFGYLIFFGSFIGGIYTIDLANFGKFNIGTEYGFHFMKLKMTYTGLSIIGLSSIIFKIFCPKEISAYKDGREFIENAVATSYPDEIRRYRDEIANNFWYDSAVTGIDKCRGVELIETNISRAAEIHGISNNPLPRADWLDKNLNSINSILDVKYRIMVYT